MLGGSQGSRPVRASAGLLLFVTGRSLRASPVTLVLLVLAVAAAVTFQIPNTANLEAYAAELFAQGVSSWFGDVRIRPAKGAWIDDADALAARAARTPGVESAQPVMTAPGALARQGRSAVAPVLGIDPAAARRPYRLAEGSDLAPGDDAGVLVGNALARRLGASVGDTVELRIILGTGDEPSEGAADLLRDGCSLGLVDCDALEQRAPVVSLLRYTVTVRGICVGAFGAFETVFVDRAFLAEAAGRPGAASAIHVYARDHAGAQALADAVERELAPTGRAASGGLEVRSWMEESPNLRSSIGSIRAVSGVSQGMALTAVVIPVWALLYIHVLHRQRDIGLFGALGFSRGEIFACFLLQALVTAALGIAIGSGAGYALIRWFAVHPLFDADGFVIRPVAAARAFVEPALVVLAATLGAGLYPAWRAARVDPATVLRGLT